MPTPEQHTPVYSDPATWTEADVNAALETALWFDTNAGQLAGRYGGMHVAVLDKRIIDADREKQALFDRLDARGDAVPTARLIIRYVPGEDEPLSY
jgi:hypothetical protein